MHESNNYGVLSAETPHERGDEAEKQRCSSLKSHYGQTEAGTQHLGPDVNHPKKVKVGGLKPDTENVSRLPPYNE